MNSFQLQSPLTPPSSHNIQNPKNPPSLLEPTNNNSKPKAHFPCEDIFSNLTNSLHLSIDTRDPKHGSCIHAKVLKSGLDTTVIVANSLLNLYAKCGLVENAARVFEEMPHRTIVSWTTMIMAYGRAGLVDKAIILFRHMLGVMQPNEYTLSVILQVYGEKCDPNFVRAIHCCSIKRGFTGDKFLQDSLINAYAESGCLGDAEKLLEMLFDIRDVVSWTSIISSYVRHGMVERALSLFVRMQEDGVVPNEVTILSILQACSVVKCWKIFGWIHGVIMKQECCKNSLVVNSLVEMYSLNGYYREGIKIFCNFCFSGRGFYLSPETMATLLKACGNIGSLKLGEEIHGYLIKLGFSSCTVIENCLIDMYGEHERDDSAFQIFTRMSTKDIISWNTMITCLVKNERSSEALDILKEIHFDGASPDFVTMLMSIQACSNLASLPMGQITHCYLIRAGLINDIFVLNSLIDLYAKSGRLDFAEMIFKEMPKQDLGSWNSMIAAYGFNGNGSSALRVYTGLKESGIHQPNEITFVNILSACAHSGLLKEGYEIFNSMGRDYGVQPSMEHFASVVDLFGRSGRLEEALGFIEKMETQPGPDVWGALLGAAVLFSSVEVAEMAAAKLSELDPNNNIWKVLLSNVYAGAGRWEDAAKLRAEVRGLEELGNEGGWSSVEVRGDDIRFRVCDIKHPESEKIYDVLHGLHEHIRATSTCIVKEK